MKEGNKGPHLRVCVYMDFWITSQFQRLLQVHSNFVITLCEINRTLL